MLMKKETKLKKRPFRRRSESSGSLSRALSLCCRGLRTTPWQVLHDANHNGHDNAGSSPSSSSSSSSLTSSLCHTHLPSHPSEVMRNSSPDQVPHLQRFEFSLISSNLCKIITSTFISCLFPSLKSYLHELCSPFNHRYLWLIIINWYLSSAHQMMYDYRMWLSSSW